jgi:hypothetical protein
MGGWTKARVVGVSAAVAVLLGAVFIAPGSASVARATSSADCDVIQSIGDTKSSLSANDGDVAALAASFKSASKKVSDKKLKSALSTIGGIYKSVDSANGKIAKAAVVARNIKKYTSAFAVFTKALVECTTSNITLPNVTIPSVTLPPGVTLPSGVTLPNVTLPR